MHSSTAIDPDALLAPVGAAVDELAVLAAEGRVRDLSHDQLSALVAGVRREQARLEAVLLTAVGEVDARGSHVHDGALSSGAWLRMRTNATPNEATGTVRTARVLRSGVLPETAAALAAGDISPQHARVITSGVADAPAAAVALIEREAVEAARSADVRAAAGVMKAFQHALDPDDADAAAVRRYERAGITLTPTLDGSLAITGTADEVSGATLATAVDAASPLLPGDRRTAARRRLDGLVAICRRYLASPDAPRTGRVGHPHVIVTVDAHTLAADASAAAPGRAAPDGSPKGSSNASMSGSPGATLSWIGRIAGSTARRLGCSSLATIVAIGPDGRVVEAGSQRRFFTAAAAPGHHRPRRRPLLRPVLRPAHHLGGRPSPDPGRAARSHHRRQRRPALRRAPPARPRGPLAARTAARRPLPAPTSRRQGHRPRSPSAGPQPSTAEPAHVVVSR